MGPATEQGIGGEAERLWLQSVEAERKATRRGALTLAALTLLGVVALVAGTLIALRQQQELSDLEDRRVALVAELDETEDKLGAAHEEESAMNETLDALRQEVRKLEGVRDGLLSSIDQGRAEEEAATVRQELATKTGAQDRREEARVLWKKGAAAFKAGDMKAARSYYEQSRRADRTYAPPYSSLGRLTDDPVQKKKLFEEAISRRPAYVPAIHNLALLYFNQGQYELAREKVNRALELNPDYDLSKGLSMKLERLGH